MLRRVLALVAVSVAFATSLSVCATAHAAPDIDAQLQEADRLAWLTDWASALPVYVEAEARARTSGTPSQLLYAKFGRLRAEMQGARPRRPVGRDRARSAAPGRRTRSPSSLARVDRQRRHRS